jgi:hypothetical protein
MSEIKTSECTSAKEEARAKEDLRPLRHLVSLLRLRAERRRLLRQAERSQ